MKQSCLLLDEHNFQSSEDLKEKLQEQMNSQREKSQSVQMALDVVVGLQQEKLLMGHAKVAAPDDVLSKLNQLADEMPNFSEVIEDLKAQFFLQQMQNQPIYFQPIILGGDPGVGKSFFVDALAKILDLPLSEQSFESSLTGASLTGTPRVFFNARVGQLADSMAKNSVANLLFFVDEIDKSTHDERMPSPVNVLHKLWESETARKFQDAYLEFQLDTSHINWIAAANRIEAIPNSIRSRANVYDIKVPDEVQMQTIVSRCYHQLREKLNLQHCSAETLNHEVTQRLFQYAPREMKKRLRLALQKAYLDAHENQLSLTEIQLHHLPILHGDDNQKDVALPESLEEHQEEYSEAYSIERPKRSLPIGFLR